MTKAQMRELMTQAVAPHKICRVFFQYHPNYWYTFPLIVGKRLFLGVEESDFLLNGYMIRRFQDMTKLQIKDDKCLEIAIAEGLLEQLPVPDVDITDWRTALSTLQKLDKNIIVESENLDQIDDVFLIGRIVKVLRRSVFIRHFDADGNWEEELTEMPFSQITSITFGSRYVEIFSKYLPPLPSN